MSLVCKHVNKTFQSGNEIIEIFNDISILVSDGEWISLIGPSGSGKSTLLKMLYGIVRPDSGSIFINGNNIHSLSMDGLQQFRRDNIAFIFQDFKLLEQYSVLENVMLPLLPYGNRISLIEEAKYLLNQVGLKDKINNFPKYLSGGEKQRVAIARALMTKPKYLLCDEPTGNLDNKSRDTVLAILKDLNQSGLTLVIVTHDQYVAQKGDRTFRIGSYILEEVIL